MLQLTESKVFSSTTITNPPQIEPLFKNITKQLFEQQLIDSYYKNCFQVDHFYIYQYHIYE